MTMPLHSMKDAAPSMPDNEVSSLDMLCANAPLKSPAGREFAAAIVAFRAAAMKFDPTIVNVEIGFVVTNDESAGFALWSGVWATRSSAMESRKAIAA